MSKYHDSMTDREEQLLWLQDRKNLIEWMTEHMRKNNLVKMEVDNIVLIKGE